MKDDRDDFDLRKRILDKSIEAYILGLETINRLTIQYRLETFSYLICNAWELMLKAKILGDTDKQDSIYKKKQTGKTKKSLSLRDCLKQVIVSQKDPVRRNIERIAELRDESAHLVISQIPCNVMCLFQSGVINYHDHLGKWFGESLSDRVPVGMMSILYDIPERWDMTNQRLRRNLGQDAVKFLTSYCAEVEQESKELQHSPKFSIGIDCRLVIAKNLDNADIALSSGTTGNVPTRIVERPRDSGRSHPFRQKEVIEQVKEKLQINSFDIQCVNKVYKIKAQPDYFYQGTVTGSPGQYSQAFVDWLVDRHSQDSQFFQKARTKAKSKI